MERAHRKNNPSNIFTVSKALYTTAIPAVTTYTRHSRLAIHTMHIHKPAVIMPVYMLSYHHLP